MPYRKKISDYAMFAALAVVIATNATISWHQNAGQQNELDARGVWMKQVDKDVKKMLERHEAEDLLRKPEDVPDRFTGSDAEKLIERIEALEERVRASDD